MTRRLCLSYTFFALFQMRLLYQRSTWTRSIAIPSVVAFLACYTRSPKYITTGPPPSPKDHTRVDVAIAKSAAPRSGVSDQPNSGALPPKLPKLINFIKFIEPRARRAPPQGHGKSLPDAVKTIDFPSVLEGFRANPSNRLRPRREGPGRCKNSNLRYCGSI